MNYTDTEINQIRAEIAANLATQPQLTGVEFDGQEYRFRFAGGGVPVGMSITVLARSLADLAGANDSQLKAVKATPQGNAVHWQELDVQMTTIALLEILTGLRTLKSAQQRSGAARSEAKAAAVRANGAKGGRPRKHPKSEAVA